jgi:hypothetical protein
LIEVDIDTVQVSISDAKQILANARVKFKEYPRESLVKYNTSMIDGIKQVDFIMLKEEGFVFDPKTGYREEIESHIILAIDEKGYYQQKIVDGESGEKVYINAIPFIPFWVFSDRELKAGEFPQKLGYLAKISEQCYYRYILSADFKEALVQPTTYIGVGSDFSIESFTKVNGTSAIAKGESNLIPSDSLSIQSDSTSTTLDSYFKKFADSKETLKSYGAYIPDGGVKETATKTRSNSAQQNAVLVPMVDNITEGVKALFFYAGIFEGIFSADNMKDSKELIKVSMNKDFEAIVPTADEYGKYISGALMARDGGLYDDETVVKYLVEKGCYPSDTDSTDVTLGINKSIEE